MNMMPWAVPQRLLELGESDAAVRRFVGHNVRHLRLVHGGFSLATENKLSFDPRKDYWWRPGRRAAVWYLATRCVGGFAPVGAMRGIALEVCRALDSVSEDEPFADVEQYYPRWGELVRRITDERLPALARSASWTEWRNAQGGDLKATLQEDVADFLTTTVKDGGWAGGEPPVRFRLPWFPYLGGDAGDLVGRRAFFFGWANLFCATNAYRFSGAQNFAPILQNTPAETLLGYVGRWMGGEDPREVGFRCMGVKDDTLIDRVAYTTVSELWGLVNFRRTPYVNGINIDHFRALGRSMGLVDSQLADSYSLAIGLGGAIRKMLQGAPVLSSRAAALFEDALKVPIVEAVVPFETVSKSRVAKRLGQVPAALADYELLRDMDARARAAIAAWSAEDRACAGVQLLLDAVINAGSVDVPPVIIGTEPSKIITEPPGVVAVPVTSPEEETGERVRLPAPLVQSAQLALSYLRAGLHVVLAGAPGTGKTLIAQFVADAWNREEDTIARELHLAKAPPTVVANSAWSPFHTIGGLVPDENQRFVPTPGVFVAPPTPGARTWSLLPGAIVLDEMNRADLDRCIGDLYPMLSGTVRSVRPAGLPGVDAITIPARFRLVATVNDATIDDVVFPMSQGLARRFVRIELPGASAEDVANYLQDQIEGDDSRLIAAEEAVDALFEAAKEEGILGRADGRLPFGAGWFALLGRWASGQYTFPVGETQASDGADARRALAASLRSAVHNPRLAKVLLRVESGDTP